MKRVHGKALDVEKLKSPVLKDLNRHVEAVRAVAEHLAASETPAVQEACYVCTCETAEPFAEVLGFQYVQCSDCSHVYTTKRYSREALSRFYEQNDYYSQITYANRETCFYRRDHVARPKVEFAREFLEQEAGVWIDVGSGIGDLVSVVRNMGWQAVGLELSESSVAFGEETFGVSLLRQTLEDYAPAHPELKGCVDVLSFMGVLEHVVNPLELLELARMLLSDDGIILVQVPNAESISSMLQEVFPQNVSRHLVPYSHIMLFTESSLLRTLASKGFEPLAIWNLGLDVYELLNQLVLLDERVAGSRLYGALAARINVLQQVFDDDGLGDGLICVARKKDSSGGAG